jgi:large subunit ribosomal protein L4
VKLDVYNQKGEKVSKIELSDAVFGVAFNEAVVHQALLMQLANRRLGTADTKTRGEVAKSTKKLFAQKHTGRARRGGANSPLLKGGGVTFGPHPRSYRQAMPKKMRRLALKCVLSAKANSGDLKVIDKLELDQPKTREMFDMLVALGIDTTVLIATVGAEDYAFKSMRNLAGVKMVPANLLNVADLLSYRGLLMTKAAVQKAEELWEQDRSTKAATGK